MPLTTHTAHLEKAGEDKKIFTKKMEYINKFEFIIESYLLKLI